MYLLVDCNNFFASVEQVFAPKLRNKPVVVASSGDGCAIARSKEAKELGIPMGAPLFKYRDLINRHDVITMASNFPLYGDMSRRVMSVLEQFGLELEIYSVDEAFLFAEFEEGLLELASKIRAQVLKWTGITVSIGIGPTKTLAKVATKLAKKATSGTHMLSNPEKTLDTLKTFDIGDVWGIGFRLKKKLNGYGIKTAYELLVRNDTWIRKQMSVVGLRTIYELRGTSCLKLDELAPTKSILRSKTFLVEIAQQNRLEEKIAGFAETVGRRLRKHDLICESICTFIASNRHRDPSNYVFSSFHLHFSEPTAYTPSLIKKAKEGLSKIYQEGVLYKRAGVMVYGLTGKDTKQSDLFSRKDPHEPEKKELMQTYDKINSHYGRKSLYYAAEGIYEKPLEGHLKKSGCYTTSWNELLNISLDK